jgi:hypothetical protein
VARVTTRTLKAKLMLGHKYTYAIVVPFDPTDEWPAIAPVTMTLQDDPRGGRGWPVAGSVNGREFTGFVRRRYGQSYVVVPPGFRKDLAIDDGDEVDVTVSPRLP